MYSSKKHNYPVQQKKKIYYMYYVDLTIILIYNFYLLYKLNK